ncbi:MAG: hypothetical protein IJ196_08065 [Prevotella sp.]|nr:hypothetical protein [Prevotella sp.]
MKKILFVCSMMVMAVAAQAQVKVAPKMQKGAKHTYVVETDTEIGGQVNTKVTTEIDYVVKDETAEGYVVESTLTKVETDDGDNIMNRIMNISQELMKGIPSLISTDKDGKVTGVLNIDEMKSRTADYMDNFVDELYNNNPGMESMLPKERLMEQALSVVSEEQVVKSFSETPTNPMCLNGKVITNAVQDTYNNAQDIPMTRIYFISKDGKSITTTSKSSMNEEEVKEFFLKQIEKEAPEQLEMIKDNIDSMLAGGMLKIESSEQTKYEMGDDGWPVSIDCSMKMNMMGSEINLKSVVKLKAE